MLLPPPRALMLLKTWTARVDLVSRSHWALYLMRASSFVSTLAVTELDSGRKKGPVGRGRGTDCGVDAHVVAKD